MRLRMPSKLALLALLAAPLAVACATQGEEVGDADSDLTRRTNPTAGLGRLQIEKPAWLDASFQARFLLYKSESLTRLFNGSLPAPVAELAPGEAKDLSPGDYALHILPNGLVRETQGDFAVTALSGGTLRVTAGATTSFSPAGIRISTDKPIVWPTPITAALVTASAGAGVLLSRGQLLAATPGMEASLVKLTFGTPAAILAPLSGGVFSLFSSSFPARVPLAVESGKMVTLPVKTKSISVVLDPVGNAFPNGAAGACVKLVAGEGQAVAEPVRNLAAFTSAVVPESFGVSLDAFGVDVPGKLENGVQTFTLNRVELEGVLIGASRVAGNALIEMKGETGSYFALSCAPGGGVPTMSRFPTGTGIDLPAGAYRVTTQAQTPGGLVSSTEEFTLP
jgi:hypothetical protein